MPARQYVVQAGQQAQNVVESVGSVISGGNGNAILVNFDWTTGGPINRGEAIRLIDTVRERIIEGPWPPA